MKTKILAIIMVVCGFAAGAAEIPDTVINVLQADSVIVIESPRGLKMKIMGSNGQPDNMVVFETEYADETVVKSDKGRGSSFRFRNADDEVNPGLDLSNLKWDLSGLDNVGIGWISSMGAPAAAGLEMSKSFEISWLDMVCVKYRPFTNNQFILGLGMDWRNFKMDGASGTRFVCDKSGQVSVSGYPEDVRPVNSRLKVVTLGLSLRWRHTFGARVPWGGNLGFELGAIANYTTHASLKSRWFDVKGNHVEQVNCDINCRRFTVDFIAILRLGRVLGGYVRYSPMKVLTGAAAPDITPLSAGLMFHF